MFELAFIPDFSRVSHPRKQGGKLLLPSKRKLFDPDFCRRSPARRDVELNSEHRAVIDQTTVCSMGLLCSLF